MISNSKLTYKEYPLKKKKKKKNITFFKKIINN